MRSSHYKASIGAVLALGLALAPVYAVAAEEETAVSNEAVKVVEEVIEVSEETAPEETPAVESEPLSEPEPKPVVKQVQEVEVAEETQVTEPAPEQEAKVEPKKVTADAPTVQSVESAESKPVDTKTQRSEATEEPIQKSAEPVVDAQKPVVVDVVIPSVFNPANVAVAIVATDDVELAKITGNIRKGGSSGQLVKSTSSTVSGVSASHTVNFAGLEDGIYNLRYNALDAAGNISATKNVDFRIDTTAPTVTIKDGAVFSNDRTRVLSFKLYDAGKIDYVTVNGVKKDLTDNQWSDLNSVKPGTFGAVEGKNTLVVFDVAGNSKEVIFTLDTTGPQATVKPESLGSDGFYRQVSFKLHDPAKVVKSYLNGTEKVYTPNVWSDLNGVKPGTFGAVEGKNVLVLEDALGNQSTYEFVLDTVKPVVFAEIPELLSSLTTSSLEIHATDNAQLAKVVANIRDASGELVRPTQSIAEGTEAVHTVDISGLAEGVYNIRFNALDKAGNLSSTKNVTFEIDDTVPGVIDDNRELYQGDGNLYIVTLEFSEPVTVQTEGWFGSGSVWYTEIEAPADVLVQFTDRAANESSYGVTLSAPPTEEEQEGPTQEELPEDSEQEQPAEEIPPTPELPSSNIPDNVIQEEVGEATEGLRKELPKLPTVIDYVVYEKPVPEKKVVEIGTSSTIERDSSSSKNESKPALSDSLPKTGADSLTSVGLLASLFLLCGGAVVAITAARSRAS